MVKYVILTGLVAAGGGIFYYAKRQGDSQTTMAETNTPVIGDRSYTPVQTDSGVTGNRYLFTPAISSPAMTVTSADGVYNDIGGSILYDIYITGAGKGGSGPIIVSVPFLEGRQLVARNPPTVTSDFFAAPLAGEVVGGGIQIYRVDGGSLAMDAAQYAADGFWNIRISGVIV